MVKRREARPVPAVRVRIRDEGLRQLAQMEESSDNPNLMVLPM